MEQASIISAVEQATAAVDRGDPERALAALLGAWRIRPLACLADGIDGISAWAAPAIPPLGDGWAEIAGRGRAADVPRLAAAFAQPAAAIGERLGWLASQPRDPRWGPALEAIFVRGWAPRARTDAHLGRKAHEALKALGDPRSVSRLQAADLRPRGYWRESLAERLRALEVSAGGPPSPALVAACAALHRALDATAAPTEIVDGGQTGRALQRLVEEAPDDLDARHVFADWLTRVGDPRAEFMQIQFARAAERADWAATRREADLLERHALAWLGPLAPHVTAVEWRLGFPDAADLRPTAAAALDLPAWRTLRTIHTDDPAVVAHPNFAGVEQVGRTGGFHSAERPRPVNALVANAAPAARRLVLTTTALRDTTPRPVDHLALVVESDRPSLAGFRPPWLTLWNAATRSALRLFDTKPWVRRLEVIHDARPLRLALARGPAAVTVEAVWMGALPCPDLSDVAEVARARQAARVVVATPLYRHGAPDLARLAAPFAGIELMLPSPRA